MDAERVALLREVLEHTGWWERARALGRVMRRTPEPGGLLLVGTPSHEPWHLAAHLDEESRLVGLPQLAPTLVRWQPPRGAAPHLAVGLRRLEAARRGETVLVVAPDHAPDGLLERVSDARHIGATVLAIDGGDEQLGSLAHERMELASNGLVLPERLAALTPRAQDAPDDEEVAAAIEVAQHLVSAATVERDGEGGWRARLSRLLETVSGPPPAR